MLSLFIHDQVHEHEDKQMSTLPKPKFFPEINAPLIDRLLRSGVRSATARAAPSHTCCAVKSGLQLGDGSGSRMRAQPLGWTGDWSPSQDP